jgi:mono/diheme cytochrome c family protein
MHMTDSLPRLALITFAVAGLTLGMSASSASALDKEAPVLTPAEQAKFFETKVRPILQANCFSCHGAEEKIKGSLRLTSREGLLKGGDSGPVISLEKPDESLLLQAINYSDDPKMPPKGKLSQAQIDTLTRWVQMGVPWPAEAKIKPSGPPPVNAETMNFWSFRPVKRPEVPAMKNARWVTNPIDSFVLAKLEANGLQPAAPAGKAALLRRAYYDLTGLPPSPEEVEAFVADDSPEAYEKVIDRLLASPQYGEKWARHWLDLVRYAETNSFERDGPKPFAWRYRDYVIRSFNDDKPYDQFIREQLAGDELEKPTPESIIATGYYRLGLWDDEPADPLQARYDELDDIVGTTGQAFLGLTVNCARCHDHKIDPIPQKDYYRMLAFFQGVRRYGDRSHESVADASLRPIAAEPTEEDKQQLKEETAKYQKRLDDVQKQISAIEQEAGKDFSDVEKEDFRDEQNRMRLIKKRVPNVLSEEKFKQYVRLTEERDRLRKSPPAPLAKALCVTEVGKVPPPTFVLPRGNPHAKGDAVEPGFLSVLSPPKPEIREPAADAKTSGRRLALANWIASKDNPLTARVMMNRVWQYHFGRGIVRSTSNFGFHGTPPTHPELLDYLAGEFVKQGWRLKPMHKLLMMSSTYRMSSQADPKALAKDPENDLCWRFDMRRLSAEEIRDSVLAVNGSLNRKKMFGPSIYVPIPAEVLAGQSMPGSGWGKSPPEDEVRRSIYIHLKRSLAVPILASFDAPETDASCPVRFATTQPTQALGMVNSKFLNDQAKVFAEFARKQASDDAAAQVKLVLWRTLQREPTAKETERGVRFLRTMREEHKQDEAAALRSFCLLALNLNEFMYLD